MKTKLLFVTIALLGTQFIKSQTAIDINAANKIAQLDGSLDLGIASYTLEAQFMSPLPTTPSTYNSLFRGALHYPIIVFNNMLGAYDSNGGLNFVSSGFDMSTLSAGWHHIAAVCNAGSTTFYIDGVMVGNTINFQSYVSISSIGNVSGVDYRFGPLDEIRVWYLALTQMEIQNDMNNCLIGDEPGLEAYYDFESGSGTLIFTDKTGHGHNGTLVNMDPVNDWITGFACASLGIDDFEKGAIFSIYPNPTSGKLYINANFDGLVTIINQLGQTVHLFKVNSNLEKMISIENLSNGIYFINGNGENKTVTKKLIINK